MLVLIGDLISFLLHREGDEPLDLQKFLELVHTGGVLGAGRPNPRDPLGHLRIDEILIAPIMPIHDLVSQLNAAPTQRADPFFILDAKHAAHHLPHSPAVQNPTPAKSVS